MYMHVSWRRPLLCLAMSEYLNTSLNKKHYFIVIIISKYFQTLLGKNSYFITSWACKYNLWAWQFLVSHNTYLIIVFILSKYSHTSLGKDLYLAITIPKCCRTLLVNKPTYYNITPYTWGSRTWLIGTIW